jgi:peptidoglycan hydrolase-like protein with peptidoglycan-binding domain
MSHGVKRILVVAGIAIFAAVVVGLLLNGRENGSPSATTTTSGTATATDPAVMDLQTVMTQLGYYSGPIDGVYGPVTSAAVTEMQKDLGVTADGVFGPSTDEALKGKGKDVVIQIQTELARYGYYTGPIDGDYGPATTDAVKHLQTDLGVTADGQVGEETIDAFNDAVADGTLTYTSTTGPESTSPETTTATTGTTSTTAPASTTSPTTT